ncbi:uncharacterized protein LOC110684841 isoform X1 [Chenopodium quinoa]|uniref:uncharacterized protein LOC110684841 isoform X1 n=1 Tax=Chenopodium quinoa TaxID=63459 RepID=UPI000B798E70|nr:uncharacterized protein LOC110684841 isoform X1 [Chenopodium quinoa]
MFRKNKAMKKEPKKEDKGKKRKRKVDESDSDDDIEIIHVDQMECRTINQRIPPKNFKNIVLKDLPKYRRAATRKIGFGGFLDSHKSMFCSKLVSSFDCDKVSLVLERNQEIEITPVDIHLVYGLPMGGEIIKEPRQEEDEEWVEFIRRWRSYFGISGGSPSNSVIINRIEELKKKPACDEFIWHFVVSVGNYCTPSATIICNICHKWVLSIICNNFFSYFSKFLTAKCQPYPYLKLLTLFTIC